MPDPTSAEKRILTAVRQVLTRVARDTAVPRGTRHPLSDSTIEDMKVCLSLISAREHELNGIEGSASKAKPYFIDERKYEDKVTVKLEDTDLFKKR
ncbi:MAG: segregation and condensation protein A [Gammaproteobacteria bacterium]|nr:segregation and condensation protein A [Gammaproteobacteria bacterium]